MAISQIAQNTL